jgi:uncharacterized protein (TIGR00375 family)
MRQIADFHIHSKYSRACSRDLTLENIDKTCRIKGVDIVGTGDFTYPLWFESIKNELAEIDYPASASPYKGEESVSPPYQGGGMGRSGLYSLKAAPDEKIKFILTTEVALIYKKGERTRRIHIVIHAPNIQAVEELNKYLDKHYNIRSDGRPILGMNAEELVKLCLSINPRFMIYPAHIWTPWFSVFGSKSGFDSMEECFGEYTKDIYAYETGLSSDPEMNWRLSALDELTLLSNSDAHSLPNIGRECNVFELENASYDEIYGIIKNRIVYPRSREDGDKAGLNYTIEFYPEEGMYHYDGHRDCRVRMSPAEAKKYKKICPVCKKPLTIGVLSRVEELADRPDGYRLESAAGFKKLVELDKIIAEAIGVKSRSALRVQKQYRKLINICGSEFGILADEPIENLKKITLPEIAEGIRRVRAGELTIEPGFDGQYGRTAIFDKQKKINRQTKLL